MDQLRFTLFWKDGRKTDIYGPTKVKALLANGFGISALSEAAHCIEGGDDDIVFNETSRKWEKVGRRD